MPHRDEEGGRRKGEIGNEKKERGGRKFKDRVSAARDSRTSVLATADGSGAAHKS